MLLSEQKKTFSEVEEIRICFSNCLKPAVVVPVGSTDKVVIEVDVEPRQSICNYIVVYFIDYDSKKKFFLREGESSVKYDHLKLLFAKVMENADRFKF
jgi:hypothetical protein